MGKIVRRVRRTISIDKMEIDKVMKWKLSKAENCVAGPFYI